MNDLVKLVMERGRREHLPEEARANRMKKSFRVRSSGVAESKLAAFAKELGRDAKAVVSRLREDRTTTKERKRSV